MWDNTTLTRYDLQTQPTNNLAGFSLSFDLFLNIFHTFAHAMLVRSTSRRTSAG